MTDRFKDRDFLKLRKEWYEKLRAEGFEDQEIIDWRTGDAWERMQGISQQDVCDTYTPEAERYYQLANQFLWELRGGADLEAGMAKIVGEHRPDLGLVVDHGDLTGGDLIGVGHAITQLLLP
jgi:hypothetical protein